MGRKPAFSVVAGRASQHRGQSTRVITWHMPKASHHFDSALFWLPALLSPKILKRKHKGGECEGFKEFKNIKTSLQQMIDQPLGET